MDEQQEANCGENTEVQLKQRPAVTKCEVCESKDARYRCPGCLVQTCSLPCVREHKELSGCDGKRKKAAFVPIKDFTESHLLSDYSLLEDAGRKAEVVHKDAFKFNPRKPPFRVHTFLKQARKRGVDLRLMPYPMTRRKINTSMFHYGTRSVRWRVEWSLPQENLSFTDRELPDTIKLKKALERLIQLHMKSQLESPDSPSSASDSQSSLLRYTDAGNCDYSIFMRVEGLQANKERYYELDKTKGLNDNLKGKRLIEFPVLLVVPTQDAAKYTLLSDAEAQELRKSNSKHQQHQKPEQKQAYTEEDVLNPNSDIFKAQK